MNDSDFLEKELNREATLDEFYAYSVRVGIIMDDGLSELKARKMAFAQIYQEKNGHDKF